MRRAATAAVLAALALPAAAAAGITVRAPDTSDFPVVHVTAVTSRPVKSAPAVRENGRKVVDISSQNVGASQKAIAIAIDRSNSMEGPPRDRAVDAAKVFIRNKAPGDRLVVFAFASQAEKLTSSSMNPAPANRALDELTVSGTQGTALYQTVIRAAEALGKSPLQSRVLIVITDGQSYGEKPSLDDAISAIRDTGVAVYPIGVRGAPQFLPAPLHRLAEATGGAYAEAAPGASLTGISNAIVHRLARTWVLTYETAVPAGLPLHLELRQKQAGTVEKTFVIPRDAGRPPSPSAFADFFYRSTTGNAIAVLAFGLLLFLATMLYGRARGIRRLRTRLEPHVSLEPLVAHETRRPRRFEFAEGLFRATESAFGERKSWRSLAASLERADWAMRPAEFFYLALLSGVVLAIVIAVAASPILAVVGFFLGAVIPIVVLRIKASRRQRAFDDQLPDLLLMMGGSLRAGHTFRQAMQTVADEGDEPARKEFKRVLLEIGIGRDMEEALTDMAERTGSKHFEYVINVVAVQREVGGNLAGLFDMVSETVRQRQQFARRVKALTAMQRLSAYIIAAIPFLLAGLLSVVKPGYLTPLFTKSAGHVLLALALTGIVLGALILKRIVSFRMS